MENRFLIFSCGFNCESDVLQHVCSIAGQTYKNYKHILVDDASTDNTLGNLRSLCSINPKAKLITNDKNQGWLHNSVDYLCPQDDDIVVIVDMDDFLAAPFVLEHLNNVYNKIGCWMTYGSFVWKTKNIVEGKAYPEECDYRNFEWRAVHLQTFKGFLWNEIDKDDFILPAGSYAQSCYDQAVMIPILEMVPFEKQMFISDVLYVYNDGNPLNIGHTRKQEQIDNEMYFRGLPEYEELEVCE